MRARKFDTGDRVRSRTTGEEGIVVNIWWNQGPGPDVIIVRWGWDGRQGVTKELIENIERIT